MNLLKILESSAKKGNCYTQSVAISKKISKGAVIKKVFNEHNPFGERHYYVNHMKGDYIRHYVVQVGDVILDPFLREKGLIPVDKYLFLYYKNYKDVRIV